MRTLPFLSLLVAVLFLGLPACRSSAQDPNPMELRTYEVPKGTVRALVTTVKDALYLDEHKVIGRATVTPDGRLAVLAPQNVQANVQILVDEVAKHPPTYDQTITLEYWVVVAKAASSPQPSSPSLHDVQPALDEIVKSQGPATFTLAQRARVSSLHDEKGVVDNDGLKVIQTAVQTNDGVYVNLNLAFEKSYLETRVHLTADRIVVLGAVGEAPSPDGTTLYYLVRFAPRDGQPR
jgi:hypothetical protein